MYLIKSETEGRVFECALQFAAYRYEYKWPCSNVLYAASFVGRPSAANALAAGMMSNLGRSFKITSPESEVSARIDKSLHAVSDRVGDVLHVIALPPKNYRIIVAPDGDLQGALANWVCSQYAVPREFDYTRIFRLEELDVVRAPECPWNLKAWYINGLASRYDHEYNEEMILDEIKSALKAGRLQIPESPVKGVFESEMTLQEYLKANARIFAEKLDRIKPLHSFDDPLDPAIVMKRIPFPAQAHAIQGLVEVLKRDRLALCCGDMGTGKTTVSLGVCNVIHSHRNKPTRVLVSAPGITIPKWADREIKETIPDAHVTVLRSTEDAARYLRLAREGKLPDGLSFVLVGIDRAKLGPDLWCAALWKPIIEVQDGKAVLGERAWHCPDCGGWLPDPRIKDEETPAGWDLFAGEPFTKDMFDANGVARRKIRWSLPPKLRKCPRCGAPLWRPALKSRGETPNKPRWFVCNILSRLRKHFTLFIQDEAHETKAQDSGRGYAFTQMVKCSQRVLALTGTPLNGKSTSIKEILWRVDPGSLLKMGFDHRTGIVQWASKYGVLRRVIKTHIEDDGIVTHRKRVQQQPREEPGIAPQLVADHLLHRTVFLELGDLGLPLVELKEIPVFVTLDEEHEEEYRRFHSELHSLCSRAYASGRPGAFSKFIPSTINAVDRADLDAEVTIGDESVFFSGFGSEYFTAKELELVRIVQKNLREDRGCIVYTFYTDRYDVNRRLQNVLNRHGIESEILEAVSPEARFEWLHRAEERNAKVILTNFRLVGVGLDMIAWPTLIFYQMSYDINSVRQASRRAWRIGQTRECRVYYIAADETQQIAQFENCMTKRAHAMLAEGRLDRSELARYGRDSTTALAVDLANCLAGEDLSLKWVELAAKDVDIETVSEERFKEVLNEARKRLTRETFRLCGIEDEEVEITPVSPGSWNDLHIIPRRRRRKKQLPGQLNLFDLFRKEVCG